MIQVRAAWYLEVMSPLGKWHPRIEYDTMPTEKTIDGPRKIRNVNALSGTGNYDLDLLRRKYGSAETEAQNHPEFKTTRTGAEEKPA